METEILEHKETEKFKKSEVLTDLFVNSKFSSMKELTEIDDWYFVRRLSYFLLITGVGMYLILSPQLILKILGIILVGLMYAHAIELQHQALHYTAFNNKKTNRFVGIILGIPMMVSFTDYQVHHWAHHKNLGTIKNKEFFNYSYDKLRSITFLLPHLFMVYHYMDVVKYFFLSLLNKQKSDVTKKEGRKIKHEYLIIFFTLVVAVSLSVYFKNYLVVYLWLLPLLVAIPVHALIELPEHLGCPQLSTNPFENTRTIRSGWLGVWFTNANNYHVEHHFLPGVPNDKAAELHKSLKNKITFLDKSFFNFYVQFVKMLFNKNLHTKWKN